jgi:hypothetical protein
MSLVISDDRVRELAERLAWWRRTSVEEAVRHALERALAEDRAERERRLDQALARLDAMPRRPYDDDI